MLGPRMQAIYVVGGKEIVVQLRPLERKHARAMAEHWAVGIVKYLGAQFGQTPESEEAWYDSVRESETHIVWGIFVLVNGDWVHVGNTSLMDMKHNTAVSGILLHRSDFWGIGVASITQLMRMYYVVDFLNLISIRSLVFQENFASRKAIEKVGYVQHGVSYREGFANGHVQHADIFTWVNPNQPAWDYFWGATEAPPEFLAGRQVALEALDKAREIVEYV